MRVRLLAAVSTCSFALALALVTGAPVAGNGVPAGPAAAGIGADGRTGAAASVDDADARSGAASSVGDADARVGPAVVIDDADARVGVVHRDGRSFADAGGKFLSLGTTVFWGVWGFVHDRERLADRNLAPIARAGIQDVRVLLVLPDEGLWSKRRVDPFAPEFADEVGQMVDFIHDRFGLRTAICLFGGRVGTVDQHAEIVRRVLAALKPRASKITHVEIANEGGHTGFPREELWRHATAVRAALPDTLVSLTSTEDYPGDPTAIYDGSPATMFAFHPDRSVKGTAGVYEPTSAPFDYRRFSLPPIGENGEPRGPQSSVTDSFDPTVIAADALATWISGWGRYVLHTGAGVYGMVNTPGTGSERPANWDETRDIEAIARAVATLRAKLPQDLADWSDLSASAPDAGAGWPFDPKDWARAYRESGTRGFAVHQGSRTLAVVFGLQSPIDVVAKAPMTLTIRSVTTFEPVDVVHLDTGGHYTLKPSEAAVVIAGTSGTTGDGYGGYVGR